MQVEGIFDVTTLQITLCEENVGEKAVGEPMAQWYLVSSHFIPLTQ